MRARDALSRESSDILHAKVGAAEIYASCPPACDIATIKRLDGTYEVIARGLWDGQVLRRVCPNLASASHAERELDDSFAEGFPPDVRPVVPGVNGRRPTYILPEPEGILAGRKSRFAAGSMFTPAGQVYAERHSFGLWHLYASWDDREAVRPFAVATPDLRLQHIFNLSLSRAVLARADEVRTLTEGADRPALAALARKEMAGDLALSALTIDATWAKRLDRAFEIEDALKAASVNADHHRTLDGDSRIAYRALRAAKAFIRQEERGVAGLPVAISLTWDEIQAGDALKRLNEVWKTGGLAGADPKLLFDLRYHEKARHLLPTLPILGYGYGWRLPYAAPDPEPIRAFRYFQASHPERAHAALQLLDEAGLEPHHLLRVIEQVAGHVRSEIAAPTAKSSHLH